MIGETLCYAFVFLAEALTAWLYLNYVFDKKGKPLVMLVLFAIGYSLLFFVSRIENSNLNAVLFCTVNFLIIKCNFRCSIKSALLHTAFLCFLMAGAEVLVALVFNAAGFDFMSHRDDIRILFSQIFLSKLMYLLFAMLGSRVFSPHKSRFNEPRYMMLFCGMPILSAVIAILSVYFGMTAGISAEGGLMLLITTVVLLCVNLVFLVLYNYIEKENENYLAMQLSLQKEQADVAYYKAIREQFENQRILVHDIKKHLGVIDALAKQNNAAEIEEYVTELNATLSSSHQAKLSTDSILNLVLLRFRDECKAVGVVFQCDVRENVSDFMDASSVTTLYGNLLSNALEAAVQSREKRIELSASWNAVGTVIIISVVNSCDIPPMPDGNGGFHTSKENKLYHGLGLQSIKRVVKKHHGNEKMYYDDATKQFHHVIQFFTAEKGAAVQVMADEIPAQK